MSALVPLLATARKEVIQTSRDPRLMGLLVLAPALQLFVLGNAVDLDVDRVPTTIVDLDGTPTSRAYLRTLLADGTLTETSRADTASVGERALERGETSVVLVVPRGFERDLGRPRPGHPATVQALLDGTDPNRSAAAATALSRHALVRLSGLRTGRVAGPAPIETRSRVLYNARLATAVNVVPGIAAMLLMIVTTIVTAMGLTRERETGTLEQILVTPIRPGVLILGKMLPYAVVGLFDFLLAITVGAYAFDVPVRGSLWLLFGATSLYLVTTLAMGLVISASSETQQQAFLGGLFFMLPASLLSGILTPVRSMPAWLEPITRINPVRHYADIVRAVLLRGAEARDVAPQLIFLAAAGLLLAALASARFQKTTE